MGQELCLHVGTMIKQTDNCSKINTFGNNELKICNVIETEWRRANMILSKYGN